VTLDKAQAFKKNGPLFPRQRTSQQARRRAQAKQKHR
jgi:hypothetical protein